MSDTVRTIWKFGPLKPGDPVSFAMPEGAIVRHFAAVDLDTAGLWLWAEVDPTAVPVHRFFVVVGTGWKAPESGDYIGTAIDPPFVWHLFGESRS